MINSVTKERDYLFFIVVGLFVVCFCSQFLLADRMRVISTYPDELIYYSFANSLIVGDGFEIFNAPANFEKILYPLILSPAFLFTDIDSQLTAVAAINSFIMASGIFPLYLLAKDYVYEKNTILLLLILYCCFSDLSYSQTFMSEVVFLPLGIWTIWSYSKLIINYNHNILSVRHLILAGFFTYAMYLTKEVSLVILMSWLLFSVLRVIIDGRNSYGRLKFDFLAVLFIFGFLYFLVKITVLSHMMYYYKQQDINILFQEGRFLYFIYSFFTYIGNVLLATLFLPVIFPIVFWNTMSKDEKYFYIFMMIILLFSSVIIAYTISIREDYPLYTPRTHMRYIAFWFFPMIVLFFSICENLKDKRHIFLQPWQYCAAFFLFITILLSQVKPSVAVDSTVLNWLLNLPSIGLDNAHIVVPKIFFLFSLVISMYYLSKYSSGKRILLCFSILFSSISIWNSYMQFNKNSQSWNWLESTHLNEIETLAKFVKNNTDKNFLVIDNELGNHHRLLDTFIQQDNMYTINLNSFGNNKFIDLMQTNNMHSEFTAARYLGLERIDYIILKKMPGWYLNENAVLVDVFKNKRHFSIFELESKNIIPRPDKRDFLTTTSLISEAYLGTNAKLVYENNEKIVISPNGFVYGPYIPLSPGKFRVKVYSDNLSNKFNISITSDIGKKTLLSQFNDPHVTILEFDLDKEADNIEVVIRNNTNSTVLINDITIEKYQE